MLTRYIQAAMRKARYRLLDSGRIFGEIQGLQGVWADARNVDLCREELQSVLEEWLLLKLRDGDRIPKLGGIDLNLRAA